MEINFWSFWLELQSPSRNKQTNKKKQPSSLKKCSFNLGSLVYNRLTAFKYEFKTLKKKEREDEEENVLKRKNKHTHKKAIRNRDQ